MVLPLACKNLEDAQAAPQTALGASELGAQVEAALGAPLTAPPQARLRAAVPGRPQSELETPRAGPRLPGEGRRARQSWGTASAQGGKTELSDGKVEWVMA